jgi:hypothetical protein
MLLGQRIGDPVVNIKVYLRRAWSIRALVTASVNAVLRNDFEDFVRGR